MPSKKSPGRPPLKAPAGFVTIKRAAEILDVSYSTIYKHMHAAGVTVAHDQGGTFLKREELHHIKDGIGARESVDEHRRAIQVRPNLERYQRWATAAGEKPVSVWLGELADKAAR